MKGSELVIKHNNLITANYKLSLNAQKLILTAIAKANSDTKFDEKFTITAKEFADITGVPEQNSYSELLKAVKQLRTKEITLYNIDGWEWVELSWITKLGKLEKREKGTVTIKFDELIVPFLKQLKQHFTSYKLADVVQLKSKHSIRIFELLMRYKDTGYLRISLDDFKFALDIQDLKTYSAFYQLNRLLIKPSINEINKKTKLNIKLKTITAERKRTITHLEFKFTPKKRDRKTQLKANKLADSLTKIAESKPKNNTEFVLTHPDTNLASSDIEKIKDTYSPKTIEFVCNEMCNHWQVIKNKQAFFRSALAKTQIKAVENPEILHPSHKSTKHQEQENNPKAKSFMQNLMKELNK